MPLNLPKSRRDSIVAVFIFAVICDIASMNIYRDFPESIGDQIYFIGQSISVFLYILTIFLFAKYVHIVLDVVVSAWLPFAVNDIIQNIMKDDYNIDNGEIIFGMLSLALVIWKISMHNNPEIDRLIRFKIYSLKKRWIKKEPKESI